MSNLQDLQQLAEKRRSIYALSNQLPVSNDEVVKLVEHAILHTPSAFNSQSARIVVLFGDDHNMCMYSECQPLYHVHLVGCMH